MQHSPLNIETKLTTILTTLIILIGAFILILIYEDNKTIQNLIANLSVPKLTSLTLNSANSMPEDPSLTLHPTHSVVEEQSLTSNTTTSAPDLPITLPKTSFETTKQTAANLMLEQLKTPTPEFNEINGLMTNEMWTGYEMTSNANDGTLIQYQNAPDYAYLSKQVALSYSNGQLTNSLSIQFENIDLSISHIKFLLQGDQKLLLGTGTNAVKEYFREPIAEYVPSTETNVNLIVDISQALKNLEGHMNEGVYLIMMIESDPTASLDNRSGELKINSILPLTLTYGSNTIQPWQVNGGYEINEMSNRTLIEYTNLKNFDSLTANVMNHQEVCHYFNLELKNINRSVENVTINIYGKNNQSAFVPIDLTKYKKENVPITFDILDYNNQLGTVDKIELLIDSNPYMNQSNHEGELEILSTYFSSSK